MCNEQFAILCDDETFEMSDQLLFLGKVFYFTAKKEIDIGEYNFSQATLEQVNTYVIVSLTFV